MIRKLIQWCVLLLLFGCNEQSLTSVEYAKWVKDKANGLHQVKEVGNYHFDIQYKPIDFVIVNERKGDVSDKEGFKKRKKELDELQYFDVKISLKEGGDFLKEDIENKEEFYRKQYYFSFDFQKDLKVQQGDSIYDCVLFHFERDYDLSGARTFVLGFKRDKSKEVKDKILILDTNYLGAGIIRTKIKEEDINRIPGLKI